MAQLDTLDIIVLVGLAIATVAYFTKGTYWGVQQDPYGSSFANGGASKEGKSRDIIKRMEESDKNCVIFYGSQTGTAEDYASRLAKEGYQRFGLKTMAADLEDYDFENLDKFPEDHLAIFVLATYGEGEPTDNAMEFYEFINGEDVSFSEGVAIEEKPLKNLKYVAFGLGNNTYEYYNSMVRNVDKALQRLGAHRIGEAGEGDDGAGTMEEDYLAWKDPMWTTLAEKLNLEEREAVYEPAYEIQEKPDVDASEEHVYVGEFNKNHLSGDVKGPYNSNNPYLAPIVESRELFNAKDRNCLHIEIDLSASNLTYSTGDHAAIWAMNSGKESDRFLNVLGLTEKRDTVVHVKGIDATAKVPFPSPTTYESIARYHMEINAPVSRQFLGTVAQFAPTEEIKAELTKMGQDKEYFSEKVAKRNLNIAQLLETLYSEGKWDKIPFSLFIEGLNRIQPRYYSISSSSAIQKDKLSITAVIESIVEPQAPHVLKGVATNYLFSLGSKKNGEDNPVVKDLNYNTDGPRQKYSGIRVPLHVRHSNFKLPSDPGKPIIMVGPGTGVAPFRGFIQERAALAKKGEKVGKTLLFFGCRKESEDFLYKDQWEEWKQDLGDAFEMHVAFSRDGPEKVYVQHKMKEQSQQIADLLKQKAYFYVCGDASHMARDVSALLGKIIAESRGVSEQKGEDAVKAMRNSNQYQEDVWS